VVSEVLKKAVQSEVDQVKALMVVNVEAVASPEHKFSKRGQQYA
jgi:hypothetical protein